MVQLFKIVTNQKSLHSREEWASKLQNIQNGAYEKKQFTVVCNKAEYQQVFHITQYHKIVYTGFFHPYQFLKGKINLF